MARRGARGYVKLKGRARQFGEATGRPGQFTAFAVVFAAQAAKDAADSWWNLVDEVEREEQVDQTRLPELAEPPTTIKDYVGDDYVSSPS